jgi:hypothetical protein
VLWIDQNSGARRLASDQIGLAAALYDLIEDHFMPTIQTVLCARKTPFTHP